MMSKQLSKRSRVSRAPWKWLLFGIALFIALVVSVSWVIFARQSVIEVRFEGSDRVNGSDGINEADKVVCYFTELQFQLRWIHSVEKQWWEEQYRRENNGLLLTTTYFQAFGAGTPSTETLAKIQKPGYVGYQINERLPNLNWVVSRLTKGEIDYADQRFLIHELVPDYSEVTITPKAYSLIDRLKKDFCHDIPSEGSQ